MDSSTSNSKPYGMRMGLLFALALLLMMDGLVRLKLSSMSKDLSRIATYPARALAFSNETGPHIAIVGNSLAGQGIDPQVIQDKLRGNGIPAAQVGLFYFDGTGIGSWRIMSEEYFWKRGESPDLLLVNFYSYMIENGHETSISVIPRHIASLRSWPEIFGTDITYPMDRLEFILSYACASYGDRIGLRSRALKVAIPGYEAIAAKIHEANGIATRAVGHEAGTRDYRSLERLLVRAKEMKTPLCLVACTVPPGGSYTIDEEVLRLLQQYGGQLIDLRATRWNDPSLYRDGLHMNSQGKQKYSETIADAILPLIGR